MREPDFPFVAPPPLFSFHDCAPQQVHFRDALIAGLMQAEKAIPCRFLYDDRGSALFDEICELPEYYPTRTELSILRTHAPEMAGLIGPHCALIELGSGASVKARLLLDAADRPAAYVPIDVSRGHLRESAARFAHAYPDLRVAAVCADYSAPFDLPRLPAAGRRIGFFPGSTIGNLDHDGARALLAGWARRLGRGGAMIVGVDLQKDPALIEAAYDDSAGVTEAFIKNVLVRANHELAADFDPGLFAYEARYNAGEGRMEMHLRSRVRQVAAVGALRFAFAAGERLHVEYSYKYTIGGFADLAASAGFRPVACWTDPLSRFSVHYLAV
jgi:dimethylhistidine N-methyltransferase